MFTVGVAQRGNARTVSSLDDPTIVAIFDAANTADIETGSLAAERGASKGAREHHAEIARDHGAAMKRLHGLDGAAFDHAVPQHEAAFHNAVIDAVTSARLLAIQNANVKALVVNVAPAFQTHMLAAENLDAQLTGN
jgi:putative membrane protein